MVGAHARMCAPCVRLCVLQHRECVWVLAGLGRLVEVVKRLLSCSFAVDVARKGIRIIIRIIRMRMVQMQAGLLGVLCTVLPCSRTVACWLDVLFDVGLDA